MSGWSRPPTAQPDRAVFVLTGNRGDGHSAEPQRRRFLPVAAAQQLWDCPPGDNPTIPGVHECPTIPPTQLTPVGVSLRSFNRLDLPAYGSYQVLRDRVVKAIESPQVFDGVD